MTPENFKSWLQGYFELTQDPLTAKRVNIQSNINGIENALNFCYYLQGYYELSGGPLSGWDVIVKDHLKLVFEKITPEVKPTLHELHDSMNKYYEEQRKKRDSGNGSFCARIDTGAYATDVNKPLLIC